MVFISKTLSKMLANITLVWEGFSYFFIVYSLSLPLILQVKIHFIVKTSLSSYLQSWLQTTFPSFGKIRSYIIEPMKSIKNVFSQLFSIGLVLESVLYLHFSIYHLFMTTYFDFLLLSSSRVSSSSSLRTISLCIVLLLIVLTLLIPLTVLNFLRLIDSSWI